MSNQSKTQLLMKQSRSQLKSQLRNHQPKKSFQKMKQLMRNSHKMRLKNQPNPIQNNQLRQKSHRNQVNRKLPLQRSQLMNNQLNKMKPLSHQMSKLKNQPMIKLNSKLMTKQMQLKIKQTHPLQLYHPKRMDHQPQLTQQKKMGPLPHQPPTGTQCLRREVTSNLLTSLALLLCPALPL